MDDMTLSAVLEAMSDEDGVHTAPVPANWAQGRTAYGGFTASLLLAAVEKELEGLAPLRSALVNFTGPLSGPPQIAVEVLRQGRNVTTVAARAQVEGKVAAAATFSFGAAQDSHVSEVCPAPHAEDPEATRSFFPETMKTLPARFFENFEARLIDGHLPFMGADEGYTRAWVRHRDEDNRTTPVGLLNIADVLPPAVFTKCSRFGPNSSMNWICNVLTEDLSTEGGWYMIESRLSAGHDGYSSQVMRMWNTRGEMVVEGMQSVVIFV